MIVHGSESATALVGLSGFVVGVQLLEAGEWWLAVKTTADRVGCPACGVRAVGHGRRRVQVRDLPIAGRPVRLVWAKRVWSCPELECATRTWTETSELIGSRVSLTVRARAEICRRVGDDGDSVAAVAVAFGVGWHTAMAAVREHGDRLVDDPARLGTPSALGLDETAPWAFCATRPAGSSTRRSCTSGVQSTSAVGTLLRGRSVAVTHSPSPAPG